MLTGFLIALAILVPLVLFGFGVWRYHHDKATKGHFQGRLIDTEVAKYIAEHAWGKSVRRRYVPDQFDGPIGCLACGNELVPGQHFWETPLIDRETGIPTSKSFQICCSCQPGDVTKVIDV